MYSRKALLAIIIHDSAFPFISHIIIHMSLHKQGVELKQNVSLNVAIHITVQHCLVNISVTIIAYKDTAWVRLARSLSLLNSDTIARKASKHGYVMGMDAFSLWTISQSYFFGSRWDKAG